MVLVEQDVFRLQVAVSDSHRVHVADGAQDLRDHGHGIGFEVWLVAGNDFIEQLSTSHPNA